MLAIGPQTLAAQESTPVPSDVSRAESHAAEAFEAYSRDDFETAATLYLQALDAAPSADILYNLARIYDIKLDQRERAIDFYRRYIAAPDADAKRVGIATERLARLREVQPGDDASRILAARSAPDRAAAPAPEPRRSAPAADRGASGLQVAGIISGAIGLVGIGFGVGFGFDAKSSADRAHDDCDGNNCRTQQGVDAANDAKRAATVSTVSFIAGGALSVLAVTLLVVGSGGSSEREQAGLRLAPYAGPGSAGTTLTGTF
jgi:tetratricopeptide (TPR) repeat protein